jgi:hypothetical protein
VAIFLGTGLLSLACSTAVGSALASHSTDHRKCGRAAGAPIRAWNLSCRRARHLYRSVAAQGRFPRGWTGGNRDYGGGEFLLYRKRDRNAIQAAIAFGSVNAEPLGGRVPLVVAKVPYGE